MRDGSPAVTVEEGFARELAAMMPGAGGQYVYFRRKLGAPPANSMEA